ncbi:DUF2938 domain-containing protein [Cribrihabitans neustonicus]|uniref:DUF2938 domain-containing protein n=1 Tax=Cribrihabitans neustonicus TaxID=1429085 RepID=UPI003B5C2925
MAQQMELAARIVLTGLGATLFMDIWAVAAEAMFGIPQSSFTMVGRWLGHMPEGTFVHDSLRRAAPVQGEAAIGWSAHYLTGVLLAALFVAAAGKDQLRHPRLAPALLFGLVTVVIPFFVLQPATGAGFMASNKPDPDFARLKSLMSHISFGLGLYLAAWVQARLVRMRGRTAAS